MTLDDLELYVMEKVAGTGSAVRVEGGMVLSSYQQKVQKFYTTLMAPFEVDAAIEEYRKAIDEYKLTLTAPGALTAQLPPKVEADLLANATRKAIAARRQPVIDASAAKTKAAVLASQVKAVKSAAAAMATSLVKTREVVRANEAAKYKTAAKSTRGRTGTPYANDRGTEPPTYIEVAQMPADITSQTVDLRTIKAVGTKYNDFFITDSQEVDAEKADVSETFGAPHVFATGRYMRKVLISGVCRTGAINPDPAALWGAPDEKTKASYLVPQTLGLRVLYDRVLRASEQISRSLFSRLVIDGEVYCGWFTTCNLSRTGAEEGFAHFTMSMLVFARYHKDEDWAAKLLNTGSLPARNAFDDAAATALLSSFAGKMELTFSPAKSEVKGTVKEDSTGVLSLTVPADVEIKNVSLPLAARYLYDGEPVKGFSLNFTNGTDAGYPLGGSSPGVGKFKLKPVIYDFAAFLVSVGLAPGSGVRNIHVKTEVAAAMSPGVISSFTIQLTVDPAQKPKIVGLNVRLPSNIDEDLGAIVTKPPAKLFTAASTCAFEVWFNLHTAAGVPLPQTTDVAGAKVELLHPVTGNVVANDVGPKVEAKVGTLGAVEAADIQAAEKPGAAKVTVVGPLEVREPFAMLVKMPVTLDFAQLAGTTDLRTTNPFASALNLIASMKFRITVPGYEACDTSVVSLGAEYQTSWIKSVVAAVTEARYDANVTTLSKVVEMRLSLSPEASKRYAASKDAVEQAINLVVNSSTYEVESTDSVLAFVTASRLSAAELNTAKLVSCDGSTALVAIPGSGSLRLADFAANVRTFAALHMRPQSGINPVASLVVSKG